MKLSRRVSLVGESATIESFSDPHYVSQSTSAVIRLGRTIQF